MNFRYIPPLETLRNANQLSYKALGNIKYKLKCIRPINNWLILDYNIFIGFFTYGNPQFLTKSYCSERFKDKNSFHCSL